jgi:hypothetical protein
MFFIVLSFFLAAEQQSVDDSDEINRQMKAMVSFFLRNFVKNISALYLSHLSDDTLV